MVDKLTGNCDRVVDFFGGEDCLGVGESLVTGGGLELCCSRAKNVAILLLTLPSCTLRFVDCIVQVIDRLNSDGRGGSFFFFM